MKTRTVMIAAALAALATPALTTPAIAADRSITVTSSDLDLTQSADRAKLDGRIETAARMICETGARDAAALKAERECQADAIANATAQKNLAVAKARDVRLAAITVDPDA